MAHDVLISYSSKDKQYAEAVCAHLEQKGVPCWIAPRDILPGLSYGRAIIEAINEARIVVLIFSANSDKSPQVLREVERAVSKGLPVITFRIEDVPPTGDMEFFISAAHWLDALTPPLEAHFDRLAGSVSDLSGLRLSGGGTQPPLPSRSNLRLAIHVAQFARTGTFCCFLNATNLHQNSDVEITHVWMESEPRAFALNPDRPLPKRLKPLETWETWIPLSEIPEGFINDSLYELGRARVSTGEIISSVQNEFVPEMGQVPGGSITEIP